MPAPIIAAAGAGLAGAAIQSKSASKAADAQSQAAADSNALQKYIFDQQTAMSAPYRNAGASALRAYGSEMGIGSTPAFGNHGHEIHKEKSGGQWNIVNSFGDTVTSFDKKKQANKYLDNRRAGFETSPGYQFRLDEGNKAIERGAAARGLRLSSGTMKDFARFNQGLASDEYGNYMNRLASMSGMGQTANSQQASAGLNYANSVGANNANAANARSSSYMAQGQAAGNAINSLGSTYGAAMGGYFGPNPGLGIQPYPAALSNYGY